MQKHRLLRWLFPGIGIKRWAVLAGIGLGVLFVGVWALVNNRTAKQMTYSLVHFLKEHMPDLTLAQGLFCVLLGLSVCILCMVVVIYQSLRLTYGQRNRIDNYYVNATLKQGPKIVVIGGGTGLSVLLRGLKQGTHNITATVTVGDDGGSSGRLREAFGVIPVGDVRNCIVALADEAQVMEKLFNFRFEGGEKGLAGHSLGNLLLLGLTNVLSSFQDAVASIDQILTITGRVLPITNVPLTLEAELEDGRFLTGESTISEADVPIKKLDVYPKDAVVLPEVLDAIADADAIVLGPGSLYTSVIPNLCVKGVVEALQKTEASIFYTCNVVTQPGETDGFQGSHHLAAILEHSAPGLVDYFIADDGVLASHMKLSPVIMGGSIPVEVDEERIEAMGAKVIVAGLASEENPYRHDSEKLAKIILRTLFKDHRYRRRKGYFSTFWLWQKYKYWLEDETL